MVILKGGTELEKRLSEIAAKLGRSNKLSVGFLENATYPNGTNVATVAAIQEFGAPKVGIPPRPFFRNMIAQHSKEWPSAISDLLKNNGYDGEKTLMLMGEGIKGQLQQSIIDTHEPALSVLTLMIRKWKSENPSDVVTGEVVARLRSNMSKGPPDVAGVSTKPLVDTGNLLNSVDFKVE